MRDRHQSSSLLLDRALRHNLHQKLTPQLVCRLRYAHATEYGEGRWTDGDTGGAPTNTKMPYAFLNSGGSFIYYIILYEHYWGAYNVLIIMLHDVPCLFTLSLSCPIFAWKHTTDMLTDAAESFFINFLHCESRQMAAQLPNHHTLHHMQFVQKYLSVP